MTEENSNLIAATVLDPRFKELNFLPPDANKRAYYKFASNAIDKLKVNELLNDSNLNKDLAADDELTKENFLIMDEDKTKFGFKNSAQEIKLYVSYQIL